MPDICNMPSSRNLPLTLQYFPESRVLSLIQFNKRGHVLLGTVSPDGVDGPWAVLIAISSIYTTGANYKVLGIVPTIREGMIALKMWALEQGYTIEDNCEGEI